MTEKKEEQVEEESVQPSDSDRFLMDQTQPSVLDNDPLLRALDQARTWEKVARSERARRLAYEEVLTPAQRKKFGLPVERPKGKR